MSARLETRANAAGERAAKRTVLRLRDATRAALPGFSVEAEPGRVVISGRGLWRRWLRDAALRWPGGLLR